MEKCKLLLKYKFFYWISLCVLGLMFYLLGYILVTLYYPYKIIDIKQPIKIIEKQVVRGEQVEYMIEYFKHIDLDATLLVQFYNIDTNWYMVLPLEYTNIFPGASVAIKSAPVPKEICPGRYKLVITLKYQINFFRVINKTVISEVFNVI